MYSPPARVALRVVVRSQDTRILLEEGEAFLLVPDVVARGVAVDRQVLDLGHRLVRDAEAARHVLDVDHGVVDPVLVDQPRQQAVERAPAGLAHDVADEQQLHRANSTERVSRMTVTLIWPG